MKVDKVKVIDLANELGIFLKVVTSVKAFENYNSFFNIYDQFDEPCRRIVVLTPFNELEEVNDENPDKDILKGELIEGNVWLEEYPLLVSPKDIMLDKIEIAKELAEKIRKMFLKSQ
ncbi:hypothetical protein [Clostridium paridis]|uniref:Uncharacterized protein n=1 Tax=Clostridium paridis TaxID=2803863 RepID=A0A937FIA0_9CLOT|nr:hypothetical protein [Clostridium paridis]MBL4932822.1 hypothetical protein [Clostridium paridis]